MFEYRKRIGLFCLWVLVVFSVWACDDSNDKDSSENTNTLPADTSDTQSNVQSTDSVSADTNTGDTNTTVTDTGSSAVDTTAVDTNTTVTDTGSSAVDTTAVDTNIVGMDTETTSTDSDPVDTDTFGDTAHADSSTGVAVDIPTIPGCDVVTAQSVDECNDVTPTTGREVCSIADCAVCVMYNKIVENCSVADCTTPPLSTAIECAVQYDECVGNIDCGGAEAIVTVATAACWTSFVSCAQPQ